MYTKLPNGPIKYRVRKGLFNSCVLQRLMLVKYSINDEWEIAWLDVPYSQAPRAVKSILED